MLPKQQKNFLNQQPLFTLKKALIILGFLMGGIIVYLTPLKAWLSEDQYIVSLIKSFGEFGPAVYLGISIFLVIVGVPRFLLCTLGGLAFGFLNGLILSMLGSLIGSYLVFLFTRKADREWSLHKWPKLRSYQHLFSDHGKLFVFCVRQIPMPGYYNNIVLALSKVNHQEFILGSFFGYLPVAVPATLLGAGFLQTDSIKFIQSIGLSILCMVIIGYILRRFLRPSYI